LSSNKKPRPWSGLFVCTFARVKNRQDIIAARATPAGVGAVAVVRVSGPGVFELVDRLLKKPVSNADSHTAHFRALWDEDGLVDEALLTVFRAPHGYTGDDTVEISTHGSPYIVDRLIQALCRQGARPADAGEFTLRAFLNGKLDLAQAEAVADLISSESAASHKAALGQLRGGISEEISLMRTRLIDFAALIELELDFSEEDVEFARRDDLIAQVNEALEKIQTLLKTFAQGNAVKEGVQVVFAGRPNAGKSTLFNLLLQEDRAIVSDIAGTTRDALEDVLLIEGMRYRLIDTAGIREATDTIEKLGIERTWQYMQGSAMVLYVADVSDNTPLQLLEDLNTLAGKAQQVWVVGNKTDLVQDWNSIEWQAAAQAGGAAGFIGVSGKNPEDRQQLREYLYQNSAFKSDLSDQTLITNQRHFHAFLKAEESLLRVLEAIEAGISKEMLAFDLREALAALGEITGEITTEDLLGSIFGKFCIGK
jgi:tRNA modification GTPase